MKRILEIEHVSITVKFITNRAIANQITRHRIASFCQESTRFCNYSQEQFGNEITVISPCYIQQPEQEFLTTSCSAKAVRSSEMAGIEDHEIMSKHAKPRKRPLAGKKALAYWDCYINGMSESEIADQFHVSRQVVSAMLKTLNAKECPYSSCCFTCPQADCIIEDEYATLVNLNETDCEEYDISRRKQMQNRRKNGRNNRKDLQHDREYNLSADLPDGGSS